MINVMDLTQVSLEDLLTAIEAKQYAPDFRLHDRLNAQLLRLFISNNPVNFATGDTITLTYTKLDGETINGVLYNPNKVKCTTTVDAAV